MDNLKYSNLQSELVKYGTLLVDKYKSQLKIDGTQATGDTEKSLSYLVSDGRLEVLADKSIEYIDKGREPGESPPLSAIAQWARAKGIKPRGRNGSFIESNSTTEFWMIKNIAKSIAENGTIKRFAYKGSGIIDFVYQNQKEEMLNNIFAAYGRDVQEVLNEIAKTK